MDESITKEISIEGVSSRDLFGTHGVYLERMAALSPRVKIVARGDTVKVLGSKADVEAFERKMRGLLDYYSKYGHISTEVVEQSFAPGLGEHGVDAPAENREVIVYGNNGLAIRARTPNQQLLVKTYSRCDLTFAVGPAGSGKTYTAIALAVGALKEKQVRRIILTRPAVEAGEKLGFPTCNRSTMRSTT